MEKKILFLINPISGQGIDRDLTLKKLEHYFPNQQIQTIKTSGASDDGLLLKELQSNQYNRLLIGGGDGTVSLAAKVILKNQLDIPIGIIPMGSANGLARCLGIEDLPSALNAIRESETTSIDILSLNDTICLHLADFGFNAGIIRKFEQEDERGMMSYFKSSLRQFMEMRPYNFSLITEGQEINIEARMLVIANGDRYGTGAIINPDGKIDDGKMEVIAFNPDGFDEILSLSLALFSEELDQCEYFKTWRVTEAEIINHDGADFHIDGETQEDTQSIKVSCKANQLQFYSHLQDKEIHSIT